MGSESPLQAAATWGLARVMDPLMGFQGRLALEAFSTLRPPVSVDVLVTEGESR